MGYSINLMDILGNIPNIFSSEFLEPYMYVNCFINLPPLDSSSPYILHVVHTQSDLPGYEYEAKRERERELYQYKFMSFYCRGWAGLEKFGLEEFEEKKFWKSELYIDNGKKIHNALALTKVGWMGTFMMLFANKNVKEAEKKTRDTPGNLQGDGRYGYFHFPPLLFLPQFLFVQLLHALQ